MNLAQAFFDAARLHPNRAALVLPGETLSYAELGRRAAGLSNKLRDEPARAVAILASRSATAYAAVLAALAAGHSYVPLNPAFPAARNLAILKRSQANTLIVGDEATTALAELLTLCDTPPRLITPDSTATGDVSVASVGADAVAYVLFTSGSTGAPKGVVVRHRNVQRYVENFLKLYPIFPSDRLSQTFDLTFDLSVHDQFVCWAAGATLVVYPTAALASPLSFTRDANVNVWFSVPSVIAHLESARKLDDIGLPQLRLSLFCGEKFSYNAWRLWRRVAPNSRIVNLYGPTEATIAMSHFEVPPDFAETEAPQGVVPIGTPLPGQGADIRREDDTLAATGEVGALWLLGDQLSAGYLHEPALTAERFVTRAGTQSYRTGDRAAKDEHGRLTFFGREDLQVKIMGYRVELGDIEHALRSVSESAEAVALLLERDGLEELCAVLPQGKQAEKSALKRAMEQLLPSYMRPRRYCFVAEYPRNASGKIDRAALTQTLKT